VSLFSSSEGQFSYESDALKQGIFCHYLLAGLTGKAAVAGKGTVKLDALVKYVQDEVRIKAKEDNGPKARQNPKLVGDGPTGFALLSEASGGGGAVGLVGDTNSIGMKLKLIPKGSFEMGSPAAEFGRDNDEGPQHTVEISKAFHIGVYEVTQEEYQKVMGTNPSFFSSTGAGAARVAGMNTKRFPVESVSWDDANTYCKKLTDLPAEKLARRTYRLPTEAEWEYACRAGTKTPFHYGPSLTSTQANMNGLSPYGGAPNGPNLPRTEEVGKFLPNAFGLYDMHGNVLEWCADWFDTMYYARSARIDPTGGLVGTSRILRGGGWETDGRKCRCTYRSGNTPTNKANTAGFRVVCVVAPR